MTGDTAPLQYPSHSWILGRVWLNCVSQCTIDPLVGRSQSRGPGRIPFQQAFNPPPACFTVTLLPSLASPQVSASRTTLTETPLFEFCSAKVGLCHVVLHQHVSRGPGHHLCGSLHSDLNVKCIVTVIRVTARIRSILSASHLSDSGILLMFAEHVLIAIPCSVTTTASDDESSISTNTPGWNRGFHFLLLLA